MEPIKIISDYFSDGLRTALTYTKADMHLSLAGVRVVLHGSLLEITGSNGRDLFHAKIAGEFNCERWETVLDPAGIKKMPQLKGGMTAILPCENGDLIVGESVLPKLAGHLSLAYFDQYSHTAMDRPWTQVDFINFNNAIKAVSQFSTLRARCEANAKGLRLTVLEDVFADIMLPNTIGESFLHANAAKSSRTGEINARAALPFASLAHKLRWPVRVMPGVRKDQHATYEFCVRVFGTSYTLHTTELTR